jgi:hypothetical protein
VQTAELYELERASQFFPNGTMPSTNRDSDDCNPTIAKFVKGLDKQTASGTGFVAAVRQTAILGGHP